MELNNDLKEGVEYRIDLCTGIVLVSTTFRTDDARRGKVISFHSFNVGVNVDVAVEIRF